MKLVINIIITFIMIFMAIGFYRGWLDWLIIFYGCAPKKVMETYDSDKIHTVSLITFLLLTIISIVKLLIELLWDTDLGFIFMICVVAGFILIYVISYKFCKIKGNK